MAQIWQVVTRGRSISYDEREMRRERAGTGMEREVLTAGSGVIRVVSPDRGEVLRSIPLEGCGALCAAKEWILCACRDTVLCLERSSLFPQHVFAGGPGMNDLLVSENDLYLLCADADSVLRLDARTGMPLFLARAGVNPTQMALAGEMLVVAGGESGYVLLLCAHSLSTVQVLSMPGPVLSVAVDRESIYALCMTQNLSSLLVTWRHGGISGMLPLCGMPGRLMLWRGALYAATYGWLYRVSPDGAMICERHPAPGRAVWLAAADHTLLLLDGYSETLFSSEDGGRRWQPLCADVQAACLIE